VFLRVWQDLKFIGAERGTFMLICTRGAEGDLKNLGYQERLRHTQSVRDGAKCFMVMCVAKDADAQNRIIAEFDAQDLFVGGEVLETPEGFNFPPPTSERTKSLAKYGATLVRRAGRTPVSPMTI
jgi:hypothetical protein